MAAGDEPTITSLLKANERFYRVFEQLDYPAMEELWEKSDRLFCVHPGWSALYGEQGVVLPLPAQLLPAPGLGRGSGESASQSFSVIRGPTPSAASTPERRDDPGSTRERSGHTI